MIRECQDSVGVEINQSSYRRYVQGDGQNYFGPNSVGKLHKSLAGAWWLLQPVWVKDWDPEKQKEVWTKPRKVRLIKPGSYLHESVLERMELQDLPVPYRPVNLPPTALEIRETYKIESWRKQER